jgi:hypothetical protein
VEEVTMVSEAPQQQEDQVVTLAGVELVYAAAVAECAVVVEEALSPP